MTDPNKQMDDILAELEGIRRDAERYRWLRHRTGAVRAPNGIQEFKFPALWDTEANLLKGSVAQHLDAAIDANLAGVIDREAKGE